MPGDAQEVGADRGLDREAVLHQLKEIVLLAEEVLIMRGRLERLVVLPEPQPGLDRAGRAARGRDDPLVVVLEQFVIHPRPLAVMTLEGGQRADPHQVPQALRGDGEQRLVQVGAGCGDVPASAGGLVGLPLVRLAPEDRLLVQPGHRRDVGLDAQDGLEAGLADRFLELVRAEHVPVVGHGQGRHAQFLGSRG